MAMRRSSRKVLFPVVVFVACSFVVTSSKSAEASRTFQNGVDSFLAERWDECIDQFETALVEYRHAQEKDTACRLSCQLAAIKVSPMLMDDFENRDYVEKLVNKTVCLRNCNEYHTGTQFEKLQSYEYLQYCYFQKKLPQKAASAVYTYLSQNPEHSAMLANLRFYVALPEVQEHDIVNLEPEPFVYFFLEGANAFHSGQYTECIESIERSLEEFLKAEEGCRARCDHATPAVDTLPMSNYFASVASHFTHDLECKRRCASTLTTTNRETHEDILPRHYHYLQLANEKIGNSRASAEALASYLLLRPQDAVKLADVSRIENQSDGNKDFLQAREEAQIYVQRQMYEDELIQMIDKNYKHQDAAANVIDETTPEQNQRNIQSESSNPKKDINNQEAESQKVDKKIDNENDEKQEEIENEEKIKITNNIPANANANANSNVKNNENNNRINTNDNNNHGSIRSKRSASINEVSGSQSDGEAEVARASDVPEEESISSRLDFRPYRDEFLQNVTLLKSGAELGGRTRLLAQGLASQDECGAMVELAESYAIQGSGYQGDVSPHTDLETFEGLTLPRVAKMVHEGKLAPSVLDTFMEIGDRARTFVRRHFDLDQKLYFHFTHLVCRKAAADETLLEHSSHLSHPIHADNCTIQDDGQCIVNMESNIFWRNYSAIVYLNDDFEGGELIFASDKSNSEETIQAVVPVACGRMVAFASGRDNLHGVRGVRKGKRCAMGIWFTLNPAQSENERVWVHAYRDRMRLGGVPSESMLSRIDRA